MADQNLKVNITGDSSKLSNALSSASGKLQAFGGKMKSVGKSMTTSLTLPLVAVGAAAAKMAFDFDKSMTSIQALVGVSADKVAEMGETAKKMAVDTGKSANEAAEALFFITSAGLRGSEAMDVLNMSLKASAVGLGETKTIADLSTSAMNAYGTENLSASGATDILTAAVREGKLEASALAGAMGGVIPLASNMGVSFDQVAAAMAAMSRTGTNAAEGATQLNAILASIKGPTKNAEETLLRLGTSQQEVARNLETQGLLPTLLDLKNRLKGTGIDIKEIFPNLRALKGVLDLTGAGVESNKQIFDSLTKSLGATDEAFVKTSQSASFKMTQGLNAMKSSLLEVGQVILTAVAPAVQKIGAFFTGLSEKFQALSPRMQKIIIAFVGIVAAIGPVIAVLGTLLTLAPAIGAAFTLMMGPVGLVIAGLTAIAVIIYKNWAGIKNALIKVGNYFIELYNNSLPINIAVNAIIMQFKNFLAVGKFVFKAILKIFKAFGKAAMGIFGSLGDIIMGVLTLDKEKIKSGFSGIGKALSSNISSAFNGIKQDARELGGSVVDNFNNAINSKKIAKIKIGAEVVSGDSVTDTTQGSSALGAEVAVGGTIGGGGGVSGGGGGGGGRRKVGAIGGGLDVSGITPISDAIEADTLRIPEVMSQQEAVLAEQRAIAMANALEFSIGIGQIITGGLNDLAVGIGESLGKALAGGGNLAQNLSKVVLGTIGNMAVQMGKLAISIGIGVKAIKKALESLSPGVAIAAGIALVALGSFAKSQAGKIGSGGGGATAFANGGIVSGPTMGLVGEYPGARQNPEVIAPLNKLQNMIGGSGAATNVNVGGQIRLEGQDLLIAIERATETSDRIS
jgi:TP901 family phage tail tape measure protein